ncbi:c-type cytochrome [Iodobacter sp. HSC-16F04]|uniref:C-type cytochrome n=1 Tax=Iodobacter violaceini TaxID=3044271 RepID=A0ABX0KZM4_9NEIS|nr:c-type cytochrome [Iodobacter violacea]NHQ87687.1 c-type cytochrome [Iodobacter violacea]
MNLLKQSAFALSIGLLSGYSFAADGMALAQKNNCLACHSVDTKIVGPSYKDVALKYKGNAGALNMLMAKVKNGGGGVWGSMPMPPNPQINPEDMKTIVSWVLKQK